MSESTAAAPFGSFIEEPPLSPTTTTEQSPPFFTADREPPFGETRLLAPGERILHGRTVEGPSFEHGWMAETRPAEVPAPAPVPAPDPTPALSVVPEPAPTPEPTLLSTLYLRLANGERIAAGSFPSSEQATFEGRMLSLRLGRDGEWLHVDGRYVRPEAVVSVDVETLGG